MTSTHFGRGRDSDSRLAHGFRPVLIIAYENRTLWH
jgi:hypothetical protein